MPSPLIKGGLYRHYKGNMYKLLDVVRHSESLEELVLYETLYENKLGNLWVRPKDMFLGEVEIEGRGMIPRFEYIADK